MILVLAPLLLMPLPGMIVNDAQQILVPMAPGDSIAAGGGAQGDGFVQLLKLILPAPQDSARIHKDDMEPRVGQDSTSVPAPAPPAGFPMPVKFADLSVATRSHETAIIKTDQEVSGLSTRAEGQGEDAGIDHHLGRLELTGRWRRGEPSAENAFAETDAGASQEMAIMRPPSITAPPPAIAPSVPDDFLAYPHDGAPQIMADRLDGFSPACAFPMRAPLHGPMIDFNVTVTVAPKPLDEQGAITGGEDANQEVARPMEFTGQSQDYEKQPLHLPSGIEASGSQIVAPARAPVAAAVSSASRHPGASEIDAQVISPADGKSIFTAPLHRLIPPDTEFEELLGQVENDFKFTTTPALKNLDEPATMAAPAGVDERVSSVARGLVSAAPTIPQNHPEGVRRSERIDLPAQDQAQPNPTSPGELDAVALLRDSSGDQSDLTGQSPGRDGHSGQEGAKRDPGETAGSAQMAVPVNGAASNTEVRAAPSSIWRPLVDRLAGEILSHVRVGRQYAVLQLDPPELGNVKIELRIEDGKLHARIFAGGRESHGLIENHLPELRQALLAGQIEVAELRVTQGDWSGAGGHAQGFHQSAQGRQESAHGFHASPAPGEPAVKGGSRPRSSEGGRVSMWV